ncbi:GGDEF domain-containing protein [Pseudomonas sp. Irchel s3h17]|uniref:GGDEF domain-containing protein n=1 Tax=Pseudomonas sp. Irchel s3h17 TaxID=2009182 RepID=UPI000BA4DBF7|nr:GGDEF domain-containing protein [Pseudomonas sp. Irchel s3h17]
MYKTIEDEVLKKAPPAALQAEFAQHQFERLHRFCLLIYIASIVIWLVFDLIVGFIGGQGFSYLSLVFLGTYLILATILLFTRKARHFHVLNVIFVLTMSLGIRLLINGLPAPLHPAWLVLGASSLLYSASVMPLSRWSFYCAQVITWVVLNPFYNTDIKLLALKGTMTLCYSVFLCALILYSFLTLREAKLYAYITSKLLLDQAYIDTLTEIPNRRSFMAKAGKHLQAIPREQDHYLAMIDIDNFKKVNDVHGHDTGDVVLKHIAAHIKAVMRDHEYARLGGEEFAIYLPGVRRGDVETLAARLCQVVRDEPGEHPVTISIGLALVEDGDTLNQALIKADEALYASKHTGKDRYTFHQ